MMHITLNSDEVIIDFSEQGDPDFIRKYKRVTDE
jgi:hypothetical protein